MTGSKKIIHLLLFALIVTVFTNTLVHGQDHPNFVIIFADDLGNADVGYHNQVTEIPTPNIDNLAFSGVRFTSGYVMAPVCGPSRAALLSGRYQQSFGFVDNPGPFRASPDVVPGIPTSVKILPEYLKEYGYATGMFGKWHVGGEAGEDGFFPTRRGFDEFFGFIDGASSYFVEDNEKMTLFKQEKPVENEPQYLTDALAREAIDFIDRHQEKPFLVYLPFNAVHGPLQAPDSLINLFSHVENENRRKLCAMQYAMDLAIGRVINKLDESNLTQNTVVFFISDNGGSINGNFSYNTPYNGGKGNLYEGGIRLPYCIKWPGNIPEASVYDNAVTTMDVLPTILSILGADLSAYPEFMGKDILPFITGDNQAIPHEYLYWWINNQWAVRDSVWKLVYNNGFSSPKLFNLSNDISEQNDLYEVYPEVVDHLKTKWESWRSNQMDIQWGWQPSVGDYIAHFEENFEQIVKQYFAKMGSGMTVEIVENPHKDGINTSSTVLKVVRSGEGAPNWGGTWTSVTQFQRKFRYLHIKILKERKSIVRVKLEGTKMDLVKQSINEQSKTNEWEDFVFDFNDFTGAVKRFNIQPDYEVGEYHEIYIDDIQFNDNPNPETVTSIGQLPYETKLKIFPNPAQEQVTITIPPSLLHQEVNLEMYTLNGKQLKQLGFYTHSATKTIDCTDVETGVYFMKLHNDSGTFITKLIIHN